MPFTPSIGLSVIIHIIVILFYKIYTPTAFSDKYKRYFLPAMNFLGIATSMVVSVVILAGALAIIQMSLTDKHSTIRLAGEGIYKLVAYASRPYVPARALEIPRQSSLTPAIPVLVEKATPVRAVLPESAPVEKTTSAPAVIAGNIPVRQVIPTIDCKIRFVSLSATYGGSIVSYLVRNSYDYSFPDRKKLAQGFGISDYRGTSEQNQDLLRDFFIKYNGLPAVNSPACKK